MAQHSLLLALPDELLLCVLSHLSDDRGSLSAFACACQRLQDLAEPFLYASNLITRGSQVQGLSHALTARKERVRLVQSLDLRCRYRYTAGMSVIMTILPALVNLKELTIESPWCNQSAASPDAWDDEIESYARIFRDASLLATSSKGGSDQSLARLQSCTLHWSGAQTRYWSLTRAMALFFHPALRELTISCADTDEANIDMPFNNYRGMTCLRQLTLIECNISVATMESLLSLPSALQSLDITNRRSLYRRTKTVSLMTLISILVVYQPKLENLTYATSLDYKYKDQNEGSEIDLSPLSKLKYLALPYDNGRWSHHLHNFFTHIRPNQGPVSLETVLIGAELSDGDASSVLSYHRDLGLQSSQFPHLRTLIFALGNLDQMTEEQEDVENEKISFVEASKKRLLEDFKGRKVRIILQKTIHHHYVPPYLFREKAPQRTTIFDSGAEEVMAS